MCLLAFLPSCCSPGLARLLSMYSVFLSFLVSCFYSVKVLRKLYLLKFMEKSPLCKSVRVCVCVCVCSYMDFVCVYVSV